MLYKSTFEADEGDSDQDEYHITMPFKHSEELHRKILHEPEFESDEDFALESDQQNKINAEQLGKQNMVLSAMHKTIRRVKNAIQPDGKLDFQMATLLRKGIESKCGAVEGLRSDYVETYDSEPEDLLKEDSEAKR